MKRAGDFSDVSTSTCIRITAAWGGFLDPGSALEELRPSRAASTTLEIEPVSSERRGSDSPSLRCPG